MVKLQEILVNLAEMLSLFIYFVDYKNSNFNKILNDINIQLRGMDNLINSHVLGYKELIFLFGEIRGNFNKFWVYDTIKERWERPTQ